MISNKPIWLKAKKEEVKRIIIDLAKKGLTPEKIGLILRDQYGIPKAEIVTGERILQTLQKNNINQKPQEIIHLEKKKEKIEKHIKLNKKDKTAIRGYILTSSKLKKKMDYHSKK